MIEKVLALLERVMTQLTWAQALRGFIAAGCGAALYRLLVVDAGKAFDAQLAWIVLLVGLVLLLFATLVDRIYNAVRERQDELIEQHTRCEKVLSGVVDELHRVELRLARAEAALSQHGMDYDPSKPAALDQRDG